MNRSAAVSRSPESRAAPASDTASRIPSASFGGGDSPSTRPNNVGSYTTKDLTRPGSANAAISATAPPYEWPTSVTGEPAAARTGSIRSTSSRRVMTLSDGQDGLLPES
jgi:hypothetical protein